MLAVPLVHCSQWARRQGPEDGPGEQDIMFNHKVGVIMPPGVVNMILKYIKPVATYP